MKKIYYEKIGRKYIPVKEYDSDFMDSYPQGAHLVVCKLGSTSKKYSIDPDYAAMIAAGTVAQDAICDAIIKASELKPTKQPLTTEQVTAWNNLKKSFGDDMCGLQGVSTYECVDAGIKAMMVAAEQLMKNPVVKNAFEQFLLVAKLTKEHN
jgi:hypothetical protein